MKKYFISISLLASLSSLVFAQNIPQTEIPSEVQTAFSERFPDAKDVEWERNGDMYKVEFEVGRHDHDAWIDQNGRITKHTEEINKDDLPAEVSSKIKNDFNSYKVDDVRKIEEDNAVSYEVELDSKADEKRVMFNDSGEVLENAAD